MGEETAGDGDTPCSTPSLERLPSSPGRKRPAVSRMPSGQPTERLLVSPGIPSGPSSPDMRIQQAIASLDFTALHTEALSLNYMAAPFPSPPPELEFISTGQASSEVQPSTPSDTDVISSPCRRAKVQDGQRRMRHAILRLDTRPRAGRMPAMMGQIASWYPTRTFLRLARCLIRCGIPL